MRPSTEGATHLRPTSLVAKYQFGANRIWLEMESAWSYQVEMTMYFERNMRWDNPIICLSTQFIVFILTLLYLQHYFKILWTMDKNICLGRCYRAQFRLWRLAVTNYKIIVVFETWYHYERLYKWAKISPYPYTQMQIRSEMECRYFDFCSIWKFNIWKIMEWNYYDNNVKQKGKQKRMNTYPIGTVLHLKVRYLNRR